MKINVELTRGEILAVIDYYSDLIKILRTARFREIDDHDGRTHVKNAIATHLCRIEELKKYLV